MLDIGTDQSVRLPHLVGMGFGKSHSDLVGGLIVGLEELVLIDSAAKSVGSDLGSGEDALLNAEAVDQGDGGRWDMDLGLNLTNGLKEFFGSDLAGLAFVGTGLVLHDGDTVFLVAGVPGLDGAPGELARMPVLVGEGGLADGSDAGDDGLAFGHIDRTEDTHFEVGSWISHDLHLLSPAPCR